MTRFMAGLIIVLASMPAYAQDTPAVEVSAGYSFVRDQEIEENFHGWLASITGNFNSWFGITGEVGGNYKTLQVFATDVNLSMHSFMAGPRFAARGSSAVTPFFQFLIGGIRGSGSVLGESASGAEWAIQPGGGVDIWFSPTAGLRAGIDGRRIGGGGVDRDDDRHVEFRLHVGAVITGGR